MSDSSKALSSFPITFLISARAFNIFSRLWISSAIAHSNVFDVVSVPTRNNNCH
ncbi:hypothetical protein HanXRQr2_Chr11g0494281 [Helianthus annuus]|uniref:Uncharacterized protein n=1 Tax=Helianthus annuus TaxID=4232 RepID=A0A9K3N0C9_HELAN|nr:hypothetical protein HanXRQr2_Chr11g0494281 [Helianthus annuus]KAJ0875419.1 hypothetical protein HanPSC8_Chr11g0476231 [Helianthus annuus]